MIKINIITYFHKAKISTQEKHCLGNQGRYSEEVIVKVMFYGEIV